MKSETDHAMHAGVHLFKHGLETQAGKEVVKNLATGAVALATAVPVLLPAVAIAGVVGGLFWWLGSKK